MHSTRDHRRIHVGDEQLLAAALARLDDDVDAGEQAFERGAGRLGAAAEQEVAGAALLDPRMAARVAAERVLGRRNIAARQPIRCYQSGNEHDPTLRNRLSRLSRGRPRAASRRLRWRWRRRADGVVINADSAQVYRDLRIVTARPTAEDEARAPHRLYGYRDGADACSAADWAADAKAAIAEAHAAGRLPILAGGTGLYLRTLIEGIAPVPEIDPDMRKAVRALPVGEAHAALAERGSARRRRGSGPATPARIARALEVVRSTGRTLKAWQAEKDGRDRRRGRAAPADPAAAARLAPSHAATRASTRSSRTRAIEEVRRLLARQPARAGAGDARDRRARDRRLPPRRDEPRGRAGRGADRHPPICQAPIYLVPPPAARGLAALRGGAGGRGGGAGAGFIKLPPLDGEGLGWGELRRPAPCPRQLHPHPTLPHQGEELYCRSAMNPLPPRHARLPR